MEKKFLKIISALAVCAAAIAGLTGCESHRQDRETLEVLRRIPFDAVTVIAAKPRVILESEFINTWSGFTREKAKIYKDSLEIRNKLGINPFNDIEKVVVFTSDFKNSFEKNWGVMLQGNFEGFFLDSVLAQKKVQYSLNVIEGFEVHCLSLPEDSSGHELLLYHDSGEMLFSINRKKMSSLLELKKGKGENFADKNDLAKRIIDLEYHNQLWFMIPTEGLMKDVLEKIHRKKEDFNSELLDIASIQGGLNLDDKLGISLQAHCSGKKPVKLLFDTINGFLAMGKLSLGAVPEVRSILDKVKITHEDEAISISLSLLVEDIKNLKNIKNVSSMLGPTIEKQLSWLGQVPAHASH